MKTLKFSGYNNNIFREYGISNENIDGCETQAPVQCLIMAGNDSLLVVGQYSKDHISFGCWTVGIGTASEEKALPSWNIRFTQDKEIPYSPTLEIDVPDNFALRWYRDGKKIQ